MSFSRVETTEHCTLYLGDCLNVLPTLGKVDAVVTDPPYGMNSTTAKMATGRNSRWSLGTAESAWDRDGLRWDDEAPKVVEELPHLGHCIIWGGQFFRLPLNRGWLVWNKIIRNFSSSVCELAWTNLDAAVDAFDYSHGQLASEGKSHPTQKPLPLMHWCLEHLPPGCDLILDPFMGSGTTGVACVNTGRKFIGVEKEPKYFEIAIRRIRQAEIDARCNLFKEPKPVERRQLELV
jgi:DNA modification methylase